MWIWVVLALTFLGLEIIVDNVGMFTGMGFTFPVDMRFPAIAFMVCHLVSEKVPVWAEESLWIVFALIVTVLDFFVVFDLTTHVGFWLVAFHVLQYGGFRGNV